MGTMRLVAVERAAERVTFREWPHTRTPDNSSAAMPNVTYAGAVGWSVLVFQGVNTATSLFPG